PLQLPTDFQIRAHSPFADARGALHEVIASFARSDSRRSLVIVVHPLDNGLIDWCGLARGLARRFGAGDRVFAFAGGVPGEILCHAAGIVTVNSTIGTTALGSGLPVKVLGNAVFDVPGLTSQQPLDAFWHEPTAPDQQLTLDFLRALIGATQVKGGYYTRAAEDCRRRGALVEALTTDDCDTASLAAYLKARAFHDIDVLAAFAGLDLGRAMAAIDGLQQALRPSGVIVLAGKRNDELLRYARAARHRLRLEGVRVSIAAPGLAATQLAARLRAPALAAVGADKAARLIR